jgi:hypothetical protein
MNRVTWTSSKYGTDEGRIGKTLLFTVSYNNSSDRGSLTYVLKTALPGFKKKFWDVKERDEGKGLAEKVLEVHIARLGAAFTESTGAADRVEYYLEQRGTDDLGIGFDPNTISVIGRVVDDEPTDIRLEAADLRELIRLAKIGAAIESKGEQK